MMLLRGVIAAVVFAGLTVASSSSSGQQVENAKSAIQDNQQQRDWNYKWGYNRPKPDGLKIFCERTMKWLNTTGADATASNGTESSMQELLVDFLAAICPNDPNSRSEIQHEERHGWHGNHHNHHQRPQSNPLETFCRRTETWLSTTGANVTSSNGTDLTIQELFVDFLTTICQDDDGNRRKVNQEGVWKRFWGQWYYRPEPQRAFSIFCERTNEWLNTPGSNVTAGNGTETTIQELFVDFLTNICMDADTRAEVPSENDTASEEERRGWNWGNQQQNSNGCLGVFCERTNNWLETAADNITSSNNGTSLNISEMFVDYLRFLCSE